MTPERLGPPAVEQLSDLAWARVERGLWAKLDADTAPSATTTEPARTSRRWVWIAAPLLAAAAAAAIVITRPGDTTPAPDRVAVEPTRYVSGDSASSISFGDAYVSLQPQTALVVSGPRTLVERGKATFSLAPSPVEPSFEVVAGDAKASAIRTIETRFQVGRSAEIVTVAVERGMVELTYRGQKLMLRDGQTWTSEPPPTPVELVTPPVETTEPAEPAASKKAAKKPKSSLSERERYEQLAALEVRDPKAALAGYLELAKGTSSWAEVSLFAAARLAGDRDDARAPALLKMYLTRFPHGANAADARELLDHLQAR
ncbi:MAG: hypothetical protein HOV81_32170 [Kofleriaceae bacterium]|nr:hypothetical protein [Kofleriaceae bacterium]